ncbi:MAG: hypothetical protein IJ386_08715 [Clostridia bacterium]|nr:hypothetical protein [Clostridia bacterium]
MKKTIVVIMVFIISVLFVSCCGIETDGGETIINTDTEVTVMTESDGEYSVKSILSKIADPVNNPKVSLDEVQDIIDMAVGMYANNDKITISSTSTCVTNQKAVGLTADEVTRIGKYTDDMADYKKMVADTEDIILELFCLRFPDNAGGVVENRTSGHIPKANFILDINGTGCTVAGEAMDKYNRENVDIGGYIRCRSNTIYYTDTATGDVIYLYPTPEMNEVLEAIKELEDKELSVN